MFVPSTSLWPQEMLGKMRPDFLMYPGSPGISAPEGFLSKGLWFAELRSSVHVTPRSLRCEIMERFRGCVSIRLVSWGILSSWADRICPFTFLSLPVISVSVSQGVWKSTAFRQICSAVCHAPLSSADNVDLSLAAPSQNVNERWSEVFASYMSEKGEERWDLSISVSNPPSWRPGGGHVDCHNCETFAHAFTFCCVWELAKSTSFSLL